MRSQARPIQRVIEWVLAGIFLGAGVVFEGISLHQLRQMQQLERLPQTQVSAALPGEIHLCGTVALADEGLLAPVSHAPCAYFKYLKERRSKDSWQTVESSTRATSFWLKDSTGRIEVVPSEGVDFEAPERYSTYRSGYRYLEFRIDPGQKVHVFGRVESSAGSLKVTFNPADSSLAMISGFDVKEEKARKARYSLRWSLAGITSLCLAVYGLCYLLGVHRLLVYLSLLASVQVLVVGGVGFRIARTDLTAMQKRFEQHEAAATQIIHSTLEADKINWTGDWEDLGDFNAPRYSALSAADRNRLQAIRLNLAQTQLRIKRQMSRLPERVIGWTCGVQMPRPIPIPESDRQILAKRESSVAVIRLLPFNPWLSMGATVAALLAIPVLVWSGIRQIRFKRFVEDIPTSEVAGVTFGLTELDGFTDTLKEQEPIRGPLTNQRCIYYRYRVQERTGSGKNRSWTTRQEEECHQPFRCTDGKNYIEVIPEGAEFLCRTHTSRRRGQFRYDEWRIELGDRIYALGHAGINPATGASLQLEKPEEKTLPFILSNFPESQVMREMGRQGILSLTGAFIGVTLAALVLSGMSGSLTATNYLASAALGPALLVLVALVLHYNDLVFLRQRATRNWANIEVSLNKRHDLIPNLETVTKAFLAHERSVQEQVAQMRQLLESGASQAAESASGYLEIERSVTQRLLALRETNPNLLAHQEIAALTKALTTIENEVALMREGYNDAVEIYNTRIQKFPDLILAGLTGFKPLSYITCELKVIEQAAQPTHSTNVPQPTPVDSTVSVATAITTDEQARLARAVSSDDLDKATKQSVGAIAVIFALCLAENNDRAPQCLELIGRKTSPELRDDTGKLLPGIQKLEDDAKLPLVDRCLPALGTLTPTEHEGFARLVDYLVGEDASLSLFEYALNKIISRQSEALRGKPTGTPKPTQNLEGVARNASLLLAFLAHLGGNEQQARSAFEAGAKSLANANLNLTWVPPNECNFAEADQALTGLKQLDDVQRSDLVRAAQEIMEATKEPTIRQQLFLRAVSESL